MTSSTEARVSSDPSGSPSSGRPGGSPGGPLGASWRESTARVQQAALPSGEVVVTCSARLGAGGLGRHLSEILDALDRGDRQVACICGPDRAGGPRRGLPSLSSVLYRLPVPVSPGIRARAFMGEFDGYAAKRLPAGEHLIAFNSQALTQFHAAKQAGYESVALVSANSHLRRVARQHAWARSEYPLEGSWTAHLLERNLAEYALADRIYVASRYIRESFLEEGFSEEAMSDFPLTPDPRYERDGPREASRRSARNRSGRFEIVYVGSLAVHKGVPLLVDAVRRLPHTDIGLRLVGGSGTRGMRRFIESACAGDRRISAGPDDPLAHLRGASLCVHPAYEDGFAYAPAEALASDVPVIVSEDTGMKDLIDSPRTGLILPTGDLGALSEAIDAAYRGEIFGG
jgi:glycosyltransferase involved in cell wall biosynthesis